MPLTDWTDQERWESLAAGGREEATDVTRLTESENSPGRLLLETGLALLIPLALAALIEIILVMPK